MQIRQNSGAHIWPVCQPCASTRVEVSRALARSRNISKDMHECLLEQMQRVALERATLCIFNFSNWLPGLQCTESAILAVPFRHSLADAWAA
jgi:hypothetical protein